VGEGKLVLGEGKRTREPCRWAIVYYKRERLAGTLALLDTYYCFTLLVKTVCITRSTNHVCRKRTV